MRTRGGHRGYILLNLKQVVLLTEVARYLDMKSMMLMAVFLSMVTSLLWHLLLATTFILIMVVIWTSCLYKYPG